MGLIHLYLLHLQTYLDIFPSPSFIVFSVQHDFFLLLPFYLLFNLLLNLWISFISFFIPSSDLEIIHSIFILSVVILIILF